MTDSNRRDFMKLASSVSAGVVLSGTIATMARAQEEGTAGPPAQTVEDQFDAWVELDIDQLNHNLAEVKSRVGSRPIMAVVKCNAYGHGIVDVTKGLAAQGVEHFMVVKMDEGELLRHEGVEGMILNVGPFSARNARTAITHNISQAVFSETVDILAAEARKLGRKAKVHIEVDTGMSRIGVPYEEALPFIEKVAVMEDIEIEGVYTVLAENRPFDQPQIDRFVEVTDGARAKGINVGLRHAASSAGIAFLPESSLLDMVRPGASLTGLARHGDLNVSPIMSFKTRVQYIKDLMPGKTIGYRQVYEVERPMRVATLPVGYSDGYPFGAPGNLDVLISGKRYPVIAAVTANHTIVDITGSTDIKIGDIVTLIGSEGDEQIKASEMASKTEGHSYYRASAIKAGLTRLTI